jgi:hypothetical protein
MQVKNKKELDSIYQHLDEIPKVFDIVIIALPHYGTEGATWQKMFQSHWDFNKREAKKIAKYQENRILEFQNELFYRRDYRFLCEDKMVLDFLYSTSK